MKTADEDIIEKPDGLHVRASRKPFPWWGPFDAVDAIGRSLLLWGLLGLSGLFLVFLFMDNFDLLLSENAINPETFLRIQGDLCLFHMLLGIVSGIGILYRRRFGLLVLFAQVGLYFIALAVAIFFVAVSVWRLIENGPDAWHYYDYPAYLKEYSDTAKLFFINIPLLVGLPLLLFAIPVAIISCWRKPSFRYEFSHVPLAKLESGQWDGTRLFGIFWLVFGTGILLIVYQAALYGMMYYLGIKGWVSYVFWGVTLFVLALGIMMIVGSILFLKRSNTGRVILRSIIFAFIVLLAVVFSVLVFVVPQTGLPAFETVTLFIFITFGLFVLGYALFEVRRYFSCPKVMAWCGKGEYTPPWKPMIEQYKISKNTE
jgi:hypothetical protein